MKRVLLMEGLEQGEDKRKVTSQLTGIKTISRRRDVMLRSSMAKAPFTVDDDGGLLQIAN